MRTDITVLHLCLFTFSVIVVDPPTDCILSFLFPAKTDVLVPVLSQSTDVVEVNFVVVLKFPNIAAATSCEDAVFDLERTDSIKRVLKKSQVFRALTK